jgi:hypothetical protein
VTGRSQRRPGFTFVVSDILFRSNPKCHALFRFRQHDQPGQIV